MTVLVFHSPESIKLSILWLPHVSNLESHSLDPILYCLRLMALGHISKQYFVFQLGMASDCELN